MQKTLIMLSFLTFITGSCKQTTLKDGETYSIWETAHRSFNDENGFEVSETSLHIDFKFIKLLPTPVKTIIAYYSILPPNKRPIGYERDLAQALGAFATLEEAQQTLLKNWSNLEPALNYFPATLRLKKTKQSYFFEVYGAYGFVNDVYVHGYIYEFIIDKNGKITCQGATNLTNL